VKTGPVATPIAGPFILARTEGATNVVRRTRADVAKDFYSAFHRAFGIARHDVRVGARRGVG
jgi:hypothetical protein